LGKDRITYYKQAKAPLHIRPYITPLPCGSRLKKAYGYETDAY